MPTELLLLLSLFAVVGLWLDALRQHERALHAAQRICAGDDVQLLDQTVGLAALRLRRHSSGLKLERHYAFEVSMDGKDRHRGRLTLLDGRLAGVSAPWLASADVVSLVPRAARTGGRLSHD